MEKIKEVSSENTEETQALENGLRILARMIVRTAMSEIPIQRKIIYKVGVEPRTLSPKIKNNRKSLCCSMLGMVLDS